MDHFKNIERLFDNAPIGIFETTLDGRFIDLNNEFVKILGYESKQDVFDHIHSLEKDLYESPDIRKQVLETIANEKKLSVFEVRFKQKNGNLIDVRMSIRNHFNEESQKLNNIGIIEDITEKKQIEEKKREHEHRYKTLFENSNDAIIILKGRKIVEWNKKAKKLFCNDENLETIPDFDDLHPEKQPDGETSIEKAIGLVNKTLAGEPQFFEWLHIRKNGELFYAEVTLSPLDPDNKIILSIVRDITNRKLAEEKIKKSEYKYRSIVETVPDGIIVLNSKGIILSVNNAFCKLTGYEKERYIDKHYNVFKGLSNDSKLKSIEVFRALFANKSVDPIEITLKHKSGQTRIGLAMATAYNSYSNETIMQVIIHDITEQKKATETIMKREALLKSIFDSIPMELWVIDKNENVLAQSGFSKKKWGDYVGKKVESFPLKQNETEYEELVLKKAYKGEVANMEGRVKIDHETKYSNRVVGPYYEEGKIKGHVAYSFDITELKKTQHELEKHRDNLELMVKERTEEIQALNEELISSNDQLALQKQELEKALTELQEMQTQLIHTEKMASVGILTAGIAHEINNPVNFIQSGIIGLNFIVEDLLDILNKLPKGCIEVEKNNRIKKVTRDISELINSVKVGIDRITNIIKSLRTFSRMDSEEKIPVDIRETIDSSLTILKNKYKYNIEIEQLLDQNNTINAFPGKIGQVILNIIMNAIQAIEGKGKILIKSKMDEQNNTYILSIKDNGTGMDEETQSKLFDPFFTTKDPGEGTGIGMSIVYSIIEDHSGKIKVESKVGVGTEMTIILPVM